ncbi:uncharacterized protein M421DRAFT_244324 [Didymella exigua CBS 183.55]|uniref:Uncharacterized protein n=1 Tax=Didymella exigua CBS 183.55 TaxID=1150837 RepID=A0A6A5S507_9PLEO|nr:uncharacterized protein M421DRAFT_244324 [Didymella exigua CBS 183.55]KAF1932567.1 hypothetical protein M421DRAFT_244324 [Didymella exigua CBS 183.55]
MHRVVKHQLCTTSMTTYNKHDHAQQAQQARPCTTSTTMHNKHDYAQQARLCTTSTTIYNKHDHVQQARPYTTTHGAIGQQQQQQQQQQQHRGDVACLLCKPKQKRATTTGFGHALARTGR